VTAERGENLFKFKSSVWNNTLAFSQSGKTLAFASHDCELHFVEFSEETVQSLSKPKSKRVNYAGNPILNGHFINEYTYIGCGFDNVPLIFKKQSDGNWTYEGSMDPGFNSVKQSKIPNNAFGGRTVFFEGYESTVGLTLQPKDTLHQNHINYSQPYVTKPDGCVQVLSTCDPNGSIYYWDCEKV